MTTDLPVSLIGHMSVTPEAIQERVDAALRSRELAEAKEVATAVRAAVAIALADILVEGRETVVMEAEYRKANGALEAATAAYSLAMDDLYRFRVSVKLSA